MLRLQIRFLAHPFRRAQHQHIPDHLLVLFKERLQLPPAFLEGLLLVNNVVAVQLHQRMLGLVRLGQRLLLDRSHNRLEIHVVAIKFPVKDDPLGQLAHNLLNMLQMGIGLALAAEQAWLALLQSTYSHCSCSIELGLYIARIYDGRSLVPEFVRQHGQRRILVDLHCPTGSNGCRGNCRCCCRGCRGLCGCGYFSVARCLLLIPEGARF